MSTATATAAISALALGLSPLAAASAEAEAQESTEAPQMTMGNGAANAITLDGLVYDGTATVASDVRVSDTNVSTMRAHSTSLTFSEVLIDAPGWIVLHPVIDGRPDGDIVSGYSYVPAGTTEGVTVRFDHPAKPGDKFLAMLHSDVDGDRVFDFVFVEDGINVEDTAVFEGNRMIAHVFEVPPPAATDAAMDEATGD